jgi:hypothetical protein
MKWISHVSGHTITAAGSREHSNESSGSIKGYELFYWLRDFWLIKRTSALRDSFQKIGSSSLHFL